MANSIENFMSSPILALQIILKIDYSLILYFVGLKFVSWIFTLLYLLATIGSRDLLPHLAPDCVRDSIFYITAHAQLLSS